MKRYIKTNIDNSSMDTIRKQLYFFYGLLKDKYDRFFKDFDAIIYKETIDDTQHIELWEDFYTRYLPFMKKCKEIKGSICKDVTGHVIDQTIRYKMYEMASEVLIAASDVFRNLKAEVYNQESNVG